MREKVDDGEFTLVKIHTDENGSNVFTKNLLMDRLRVSRQRIGLTDSTHKSEGRVCRNMSLLWEEELESK